MMAESKGCSIEKDSILDIGNKNIKLLLKII